MNIKTKIKFLKLRQRADRMELAVLAQADQLGALHDKINQMAQERGAAEADMIRRHQAELSKVRGDSTDTRQRIQHLENLFEHAVEALDYIAPLWRGRPANWRETLNRQDRWYEWRGEALADVEVHSDTQGASSVVFAAGGAGGQGGANFGAVASSPGGSGGIAYGVDPMSPARSWVSGSGSSGPIGGRVRTDDERRAEQ
jgi:hypothetical protein